MTITWEICLTVFVTLFLRCQAYLVPDIYPRIAYTANDTGLDFLVIADWGGIPIFPYTTPDEVAVAHQMALKAKDLGSKFVLALGDNFYEEGIKDENDPRFKQTFENIYTAPSLHIPWYLVGGNHDHYGNITGQIAYSKKSKRWNFPSEYYRLVFSLPGSSSEIVFLMVDTVILCGNTRDDVPGSNLPGPDDYSAAEDQWMWLEQQLKNSMSAKYVIVSGHFPVWSIAEHGPTSCLTGRLRPLLMKYNVSAYFSGHDHNLQYIKEDDSDVHYFVIGSANVVDPSMAHVDQVPKSWVKFHFAELGSFGGFSHLRATDKKLSLTFSDGLTGHNLFTADILPRN